MLKFLSQSNIVIHPPKTGKDSKSKKAVMKTDQTKRGVLCIVKPGHLIFIIVTIKFIAPKIEEAPASRSENIARSTEPPEWACIPESGAYIVHPVPTPASTKEEEIKSVKAGKRSQKLTLFNLGKAISQAPIIIGTNQFPTPPIAVGITKKKIILKARKVTSTL